MDGVGTVNELPKKACPVRFDFQELSACGKIPVGPGADVIRRSISVALGRDGGNDGGERGGVPKRKVRASGPRRPKGSIANGRRVMVRCKISPITASPRMASPVSGSRLFPRHNFLLSKTCRCESALADMIRRTSGESKSMEGHDGVLLMVMSAPMVV